jgi:hypothetical protein
VDNFDCNPTLQAPCSSSQPHLLTPGDLNDFVRDLNLSKKQAKVLGRVVSSPPNTEVCSFRNRQNEFKEFFSQENVLAFCKDVCCVIEALRHQHDSNECPLFTDSSNFSLKTVLLHNGNKYPSVSIAHAATRKIPRKI